MKAVFWLLPGELAGRTGPDRDLWDLRALRAGGIDAVLSVNDGRLCHAADFSAAGLAYACVPLSDNAQNPGSPDVENVSESPSGSEAERPMLRVSPSLTD